MTMVHVAACEAIDGCMPLKADGCRCCSRFWMEALRVVEVSAQRLELHEMHVERMGVFRQVDDTPNLCRTVGHEPVDGILKVSCDGAIAPGFSLFIRYRMSSSPAAATPSGTSASSWKVSMPSGYSTIATTRCW